MEAPRRVLIVVNDVEPDELRSALPSDLDVSVVHSGQRALEEASAAPPDLVLIDVDLPDLSGYEICRRFRADPVLSRCKVILTAQHGDRDSQLRAFDAGAHDFLAMPFDGAVLAAKARVYLRFRSLEEEAVRMKSELLSLLAHEIRTPLTGVLPPAEMLAAEGPMDEEQRRMWGQMVLDNGRRLASLAERGMLLNELRSGTRTLSLERADLAELVRKAARKLQHAGPTFAVEIEGAASLSADVDSPLLERALEILLENARLFGPTDSRILIEMWRENSGPRIAVTVSGAADRSAVQLALETFAPRLVGDQVVGSDLGLALVRRIFEAHGGRVEVRAEPGRATGFLCELRGAPAVCRQT